MDPEMEIEKCKNCKYCLITKHKNGDGKIITMNCMNRFKECPNNN